MKIDKEIKELESKIDKLKKEKEDLEKSIRKSRFDSFTIEVAELLHEKLCHVNHTDMCSWYYGEWDDETLNYAKEFYYEKAKKLIEFLYNYNISSPNLVISYVKNFLNIIKE